MSNETQAERDAADCTVVTCWCGSAIFVVFTDLIDADVCIAIGHHVAHGCSAAHMPAAAARKQALGFCKCQKPQIPISQGASL